MSSEKNSEIKNALPIRSPSRHARTKLTYDSDKTPVKSFDETKRRLDAEEIAGIRWRESELKVLLWIKGCYVQAGQWGPLAHLEAIMVRQGSACPFDGAEEIVDLIQKCLRS